MTPEQAAAVERLRRLISDGFEHAYGDFALGTQGYQEERDFRVVANLYLAEHPADDNEPVTEEWLASVMESHRQSDGLPYWSPGPSVCIYLDGGVFIEHREFAPCHTRGDVRRLCAALGIPLKE